MPMPSPDTRSIRVYSRLEAGWFEYSLACDVVTREEVRYLRTDQANPVAQAPDVEAAISIAQARLGRKASDTLLLVDDDGRLLETLENEEHQRLLAEQDAGWSRQFSCTFRVVLCLVVFAASEALDLGWLGFFLLLVLLIYHRLHLWFETEVEATVVTLILLILALSLLSSSAVERYLQRLIFHPGT